MTRRAIVLGDPEVDPLLRSLVPELEASGRSVVVVEPGAVADLRVTAGPTRLQVGATPVDEVVCRIALELLVAPSFADDDRGFVANELQAFWTHALSLPTVATLNDGYATSMLMRDPCAWRAALADAGIPVVPAAMGRSGPGSWWLRDSGELAELPPAAACRALGVITVVADGLRSVLCCGGEVRDDEASLRPVARALAARGAALAEVLVDDHDRLVAVLVDPAVGAGDAPWAAHRAREWLDAAARR